MVRDFERYEASLKFHQQMQFDYFTHLQNKLRKRAWFYFRTMNDLLMYDKLSTEADNMKFQFNRKEAAINFGYCSKLSKKVSFLPNTLQLDTQDCFELRLKN
jgi:hypothetical protein